MMILEMDSVTKIFSHDIFKKNEIVLNNVSLSFPEGKCTGFLGHNGAGKTTSIRMILGLIRPNHGRILFKNEILDRQSRAKIGYMPEINKLPGGLTPYEVLDFHLRIFRPKNLSSKQYKPKIQELLQTVGLWNHRNKRVSKMSKGMARRLAWAQAVIHAPELVILDEPFSGLDPLGRQELAGWISELKANKTSLIMCTHELPAAHALCDELHILREGSVVYSTIHAQHEKKTEVGFSIRLSGLDQSKLEMMRSEQTLPPWQALKPCGVQLELQFLDYLHASQWLPRLIASGVIVNSFQSSFEREGEQLLPYFRRTK